MRCGTFAATGIAALVLAAPAFASISPSSGAVSPAAMYVDGAGIAYTSQTFTTTSTCTSGSPCTWTSAHLPTGLTVTPNPTNFGKTATITGTPTSGVTTVTNVTLSQGGSTTSSLIVSVVERLTNAGSFGGNLVYPTGMARDPSTGRRSIYVAGSKSNDIFAINPAVNPPVATGTGFGRMTGFAGQLAYPNQMYAMQTSSFATPSPFLFAGNYNQNGPSTSCPFGTSIGSPPGVSTCPDTVARVNLPNPGTSGTQFQLNSTCDKPAGIAQGGEANPVNVFVACAGSHNVAVFNGNTGAFVGSIGLPACTIGTTTYQAVPSGVASTNQADRVVVADARCNAVYMVDWSTLTVVATVHLSTTGCATSPLTGAAATYAANIAFDNNGGQFEYLTEPGCNRTVQLAVAGPGSPTITELQNRSLGPRPYAVATGTDTGSAGQPQVDASAGTTTSPATAYLFTNGSGTNWALNYAIQLPVQSGGTTPVPVGSAAILPQGSVTIGGTPANAYIADTGGNSVYIVDPIAGHLAKKGHRRLTRRQLTMCMAITNPHRRFAVHRPVCSRPRPHRGKAHAASDGFGGFTVDMAAALSEGRPLAPPILQVR